MKAEPLWNHNAFFDYSDRWMTENDTAHAAEKFKQIGSYGTPYQLHTWDGFVDDMYARYRNNLPSKTVVGKPRFNPEAGVFVKSVAVELLTFTPGAQIRFTIDGSIPNASSQIYQNPIVITANSTIKAFGYIPSGNMTSSAVVSQTYTITQDNVLPTVSFVSAIGSATKMVIGFSEKMEKASTELASNYSITNGVSIQNAVLGADQLTVTLTVSGFTGGTSYTAIINNIKDSHGNAIMANTQSQFTYIAVTSEPGLLGLWSFEGGLGQAGLDLSGNNNTLTFMGGASTDVGKSGSAASFDGVDDHLELPPSLLSNVSDFTFTAWVYWTGNRAWPMIFNFNDGQVTDIGNGAYMELTPWFGGFKSTAFTMSTSGYGQDEGVISAKGLPLNTWTHVAVILKGDNGALYIDGSLVKAGSIPLDPKDLSLSRLYIGKSSFLEHPHFTGKIDEIRIYDKALSITEIQNVMNGVTGLEIQHPLLRSNLLIPNPITTQSYQEFIKLKDVKLFTLKGEPVDQTAPLNSGMYGIFDKESHKSYKVIIIK